MKPSSAERLTFAGLQAARVAFYGAHYLAARLMARDTVRVRARTERALPGVRPLAKAITSLFAHDWRNVEDGLYPAPLDWRREARGAMASARYLADVPAIVRRQRDNGHSEVAEAGRDLPRYYRQNFHFQTDGYLSERSAQLYDFQVEALFAGTADAMRRQVFAQVARYLNRRRLARPRVLDVAAGTGRFLSFAKEVRPEIEAVALDLSEPYLAHAQKRAAKLGQEMEFVAAPGEKMPLPDASVDVVTNIYLFHELPPKVRPQVAREIARVLKPGGLFVFADSIQYGDNPDFDALLDLFPALLHEPYYASYAKQDVKPLFAKHGLVPEHVDIAYLTKIVSFEKPAGRKRG